MLARTITLALASAALVTACSQGDSQPAAKAKPAATPAAPVAAAKPKSGEIDEGLKERLARQEAAAKMFETRVLQPPAPRVPEPPAATKAASPPPAVAAAAAPSTPPAPTRAEPQKAAAQPAAPTPQPAAAPPAPAPAPRVDLAAARPAAAAPETAGPPRLVTRVDPDFPREASQSGADSGLVKARMTLDAGGGVTRVEIVEASPRRVFDRAVIRALSQWRYNSGPEGRTVEMEVAFRR